MMGFIDHHQVPVGGNHLSVPFGMVDKIFDVAKDQLFFKKLLGMWQIFA